MFRQYRKILPGEFIVIGADGANGGSDYCAAQFLSKTKLDVPLIYHEKTIATNMTNALLPVLERIYDTTRVKPVIAYERNNGGLFEMERLAGLNRHNKFELYKMHSYGEDFSLKPQGEPEPVKYGWDTNTATRPKMLTDLKDAIDKKLIGLYDKLTVSELYSFVVMQTSASWKAQAEKGSHDDLVMALAIAWQLYQLCEKPLSSSDAEALMSQFPEEALFDDQGFY